MKANSPGFHALHKGLLASLVLHAGGLAGLHFFSFDPDQRAVAEFRTQDRYLEVAFTRNHPQASPSMASEAATGGDSTTASGDSPREGADSQPIRPEPDAADALPPESMRTVAVPRREEADEPAAVRADEPGNRDEATEAVSAVALSDSIASFLRDYKSDLGQDWLEECQRYRNRYGTRDCPQGDPTVYSPHQEERAAAASLFASITRSADNGRRTAALLQELDFLRSLNPDDAATRELVEARYFLQLDKFKYLTGAENDAYAAFQASTTQVSDAVRNEGSISILGVGGGPSLLGAIITLVGKDSRIASGAGSDAVFTDYELEKPAPSQVESEEKAKNFEILPPLFPAPQRTHGP